MGIAATPLAVHSARGATAWLFPPFFSAVTASPSPWNVRDHLLAGRFVIQALPYTTDAGVYAALLDLGIASFATDHPDTTLQAVRDYYASTENKT